MYTPWGPSQEIEDVIEGIVSVSTAGHGGLKLDAARNRKMPAGLRRQGGWYEEDCEWCLPFVVFEAEILAQGKEFDVKAIRAGDHIRTMKTWFPDEYERHFGVEIPPGESFKKDERRFYVEHAQDWVGVCAFGDWKEGVPKGYVGVVAQMGGRQGQGPEKYFFVPQSEYDARCAHGFVIDRHRHTEAVSPDQVQVTKRVG